MFTKVSAKTHQIQWQIPLMQIRKMWHRRCNRILLWEGFELMLFELVLEMWNSQEIHITSRFLITKSLESMPISSEVMCPNISLGVPDSKQFLISLSILFLSTWSQLTSDGLDQFVLSSLFSMQYDSTYEINNGRNENFKCDNYKCADLLSFPFSFKRLPVCFRLLPA